MKKFITRIKSVSRETLFALLALTIFFGSVPWIRLFLPESGTVDRGGELHVMLSGLMAYGCAFLLVCVTVYLCFRTYWNYAINNDDKDDPENERASFKEDWQRVSPAVRVGVFVGSFFGLLYLAVTCLKP